jgi:SAM-dependent methyltransferase
MSSIVTAQHSTMPTGLGSPVPLNHACPTCQGGEGVVLGKMAYQFVEGTELPDQQDVVCCSQCGFVRCDSGPGQQVYDRFYKQYRYSPAYLAHEISEPERAYFNDVLTTLRSHLDHENSTIFDIGCGSGNFLKHCRSAQAKNLFGVDLSTACVSSLQQAEFNAEVGSVSSIPFPGIRPAAVVLSHILEHIVDLRTALGTLRERLADGGIVYVEVPDTEAFPQFTEHAPLRYFYPQHVVHFDQIHLDNLFQSNGFRKLETARRSRFENELTIPAIAAVYEVDGGRVAEPTPDFRLAVTVKRWFEASSCDPEGVFAELARSRCPAYVWGVGIHIQMMLGMTALRDCHIVCCVDQDRSLQGQTIGGHRIVSPDCLSRAKEEETVVIGSVIHRRRMLEILRNDFGFSGNVVTV